MELVEAESAVVECFEVFGITVDRFCVVADRHFVAAFLAEREGTVMVEVRFAGVDRDRHSEVLYRFIEEVLSV